MVLRLILGDQLNINHSWYNKVDDRVTYVLMEVRTETDYVLHHAQKVIGFFAAMRHFAKELRSAGHKVIYIALDDEENEQSFTKNLLKLAQQSKADAIGYQLPDEYRVDLELQALDKLTDLPLQVADTEHFLTTRTTLAEQFAGKKTYLMESFYRRIRKQYGIMMVGDQPLQGQWNFDALNRAKYKGEVPIPNSKILSTNQTALYKLLQANGVKTFGNPSAADFQWPVTRAQALEVLRFFVENQLQYFGTYQDAMLKENEFLFHSRLSFALNIKLISPLEVVNAAIAHWQANQDTIEIQQIEGFVRQIIGWREYMRGIYWAQMPGYAHLNYFGNNRPLPQWYWTGNTKMNCLSFAIKNSLDNAYAHHIQRLMVTGNFALLAGINPTEVDAWYLGIYIDALEWVEITNTRGMSQFADGGIVGTKPYISSAAYINKMGNYCQGCHYNKDEKLGPKACPFNSLYWNFYHQHRHLLGNNARIGMMYKVWDKMPPTEQQKILAKAKEVLDNIEDL